MFFAIFCIQAAIGRIGIKFNMWVSFEVSTVVVVAFLFGPLEAMIYGFTADSLGVFISGSGPWMLFYAIQYPITALIAGSFADIFYRQKNKEKINKYLYYLIYQLIIVLIVSLAFTAPYYGVEINDGQIPWAAVVSSSVISITLLELIFIYLIRKENNENVMLITLILATLFINRIINGYLISSIGESFLWGNGWETYPAILLLDIFKSSYLVPINTLITFGFIVGSFFAVEQTSGKEAYLFQEIYYKNKNIKNVENM